MPNDALVLDGCMEIVQSFGCLQHNADLLPPCERLGCAHEVAHATEAVTVPRREIEPCLQTAAHHQRKDEARHRSVEAVAKQRQQVGMVTAV